MEEINVIELRANRTIHQMNNGLAFYNYEGTHFRVFENIWDVKEWLKKKDDSLVIVEFENENELDQFLESYEKKCLYCDNKQKEHHFACDICGIGMCNDCYDGMVEHDGHYHLPLENCDSELEIKLIEEACGNDDPDYICESCMNKAMTVGKLDYIKRDLESLAHTRWKNEVELEKHLQNIYELESSIQKIDEKSLVCDYGFTMDICKDIGYMHVYYLKIPYGDKSIYITEVSIVGA